MTSAFYNLDCAGCLLAVPAAMQQTYLNGDVGQLNNQAAETQLGTDSQSLVPSVYNQSQWHDTKI